MFSRVHHIIADPVATFSGFCCQVQGSILHRKERYMEVLKLLQGKNRLTRTDRLSEKGHLDRTVSARTGMKGSQGSRIRILQKIFPIRG